MSERLIVDVSTFGKRLRLLRRARGLSLRALGAAIGVSHNAIAKYEAGTVHPKSSVLVRIGQEFGVSLDYLMAPIVNTLEIVSICLDDDEPAP